MNFEYYNQHNLKFISMYKYFYSNTKYLIPDDAKSTLSSLSVTESIKPDILESVEPNIHEVTDKHPFYTNVPGKYNYIIYQFKTTEGDDIQITKYKQQHALCYNFCIKSSSKKLSFTIGESSYTVVSMDRFKSVIRHIDFDMQKFFDYSFKFFNIDVKDKIVFYTIVDDYLYANINDMIISIAPIKGTIECYIGKLSNNKLYIYGCDTIKEIINSGPRDHIIENDSPDIKTQNYNVVCFEIIKKEYVFMLWSPSNLINFDVLLDNKILKTVNQYKFAPTNIAIPPNAIDQEIYKVYLSGDNIKLSDIGNKISKIEYNPNASNATSEDSIRNLLYNYGNFGSLESFNGTFEFMIKIHRNIIRNLYEKYLYIDVLDIGIGKCRDVYTYQNYVNRHNIYGVEPNPEFAKACTIKNMYNETADSIFKYFKLKHFMHKFHTIIFCNSYNFVTDPYITMKECVDFLHDGGRIIMIYMNNDKVETVKNKFYEIRKGESNPDLPDNHVLKNKQNFIQVFTETTLVPPHYENQISESDILTAVDKTNQDLGKKIIEVLEKGSLVHERSKWLLPETALFNSMFYYCVVGKVCINDKIIIAFDTDTSTLRDYINYLRKKNSFCNGVNIINYRNFTPFIQTMVNVVIVDTVENYEKIISKVKTDNLTYDILVNIQTVSELEYSSLYSSNIENFNKERKKILELLANKPYSKFGFTSN